MIFDSHCHLYDEKYDNVEEIINRAKENGVTLLLIPGDNVENSKKGLKIAKDYEGVYSAIGVHPDEIYDLDLEKTIEELEKIYSKNKSKIKAIGEIGLDYYWHKEEDKRLVQSKWLNAQIDLANKLELPIIIHSRDACNDTLTLLKNNMPKYGCVYHCFSYSKEIMEELMKLGFYIGLDGPVTFKNASTPKEVAKAVPLDRLLVETDSPYLTPTPYRGQTNEPYYVTFVVSEIAKLREIPYDEVAKATYENAKRLFKI